MLKLVEKKSQERPWVDFFWVLFCYLMIKKKASFDEGLTYLVILRKGRISQDGEMISQERTYLTAVEVWQSLHDHRSRSP